MRLSAFFFEIIPISGFFISSQYFSLIIAAFISLILSLLVIVTFYIMEKRVSKFQIFSITMSALLTTGAYSLDNENFIKIQPTIFNGFFCFVLLTGLLYKKSMMKQFFGSQFFLTDITWYKLSFRWGLFFLFPDLFFLDASSLEILHPPKSYCITFLWNSIHPSLMYSTQMTTQAASLTTLL